MAALQPEGRHDRSHFPALDLHRPIDLPRHLRPGLARVKLPFAGRYLLPLGEDEPEAWSVSAVECGARSKTPRKCKKTNERPEPRFHHTFVGRRPMATGYQPAAGC